MKKKKNNKLSSCVNHLNKMSSENLYINTISSKVYRMEKHATVGHFHFYTIADLFSVLELNFIWHYFQEHATTDMYNPNNEHNISEGTCMKFIQKTWRHRKGEKEKKTASRFVG
jgi:hypothetical protein